MPVRGRDLSLQGGVVLFVIPVSVPTEEEGAAESISAPCGGETTNSCKSRWTTSTWPPTAGPTSANASVPACGYWSPTFRGVEKTRHVISVGGAFAALARHTFLVPNRSGDPRRYPFLAPSRRARAPYRGFDPTGEGGSNGAHREHVERERPFNELRRPFDTNAPSPGLLKKSAPLALPLPAKPTPHQSRLTLRICSIFWISNGLGHGLSWFNSTICSFDSSVIRSSTSHRSRAIQHRMFLVVRMRSCEHPGLLCQIAECG